MADDQVDNVATTSDNSEWQEFREQLLDDAEAREEYERTFHSTVVFREILQLVEAEREKAGLSKAELAHRIGVNPASIRRLLTSESGNPTFKTMLGVFDALGLAFSLKPIPRHKRKKRASASPSRTTAA